MDIAAAAASVREAEIERLMAVYQDSLLRMCYVYLRDAALAEDALQETFFKAYKRFDAFRGDCSEKTWLMRIAINTCKDVRRSRWFRLNGASVPLESVPEPVCDFEPADETLLMQVMALPPKYKEVVLLIYYQGMTAQEAGTALRIALPTVYQRLKAAHAKLKCELEGWYEHA